MFKCSELTRDILLSRQPRNVEEIGEVPVTALSQYCRERKFAVSEVLRPEIERLSSEMCEELRLPPVGIEIKEFWGNALFDPKTYSVLVSEKLRVYDLCPALRHEIVHAGQAKLTAAAQIADPASFSEVELHPALSDAASEQNLHLDPLAVFFGGLFSRSQEAVRVSNKYAIEEAETFHLDRAHQLYLRSFVEIPAHIAHLETQLAISEMEQYLVKVATEDTPTIEKRWLDRISKWWQMRAVRAFSEQLPARMKEIVDSLQEYLSLVVPKIEEGFKKSKKDYFC